MEYIIGFLIISIVGGILIWKMTKKIKYVIIFLLIMLLILLLPWIFLFFAFESGAEFPG